MIRRSMAAAMLVACGAPSVSTTPAPSPEPPRVVVEVAPSASSASSAASAAPVVPEADAEAVAVAGDAGSDAAPPADACRGRAFDLDALPKACARPGREQIGADLKASLTTDEASVKAGGTIGVTLTLTNETGKDVEVDLRLGCAFLELQAFKGAKRADYINASCGFGRGCGGYPSHLVVEPGGTLTKRFRFTAHVDRLDKDCKDVFSPLPAGRYELRIDSAQAFAMHQALAKLTAPLVVVK